MPSQVWAVRARLVTMFTAAVDAGVVVIDGPRARTTTPKAFVLVGTDGGETGIGDGFGDGIIAEQKLSKTGNKWRDENGDITCSAWAWTGDTKLATIRTTVQGIVDDLEAALQADRTLGGLLPPTGRAEFTRLRIRESQTTEGAYVRAAFTVSYGALLTI